MASNCSGAYLLAEAGVLNGKKATTWAGGEKDLQKSYPAVNVQFDQNYVIDGNVITSNGSVVSYEAALALLAELASFWQGPTASMGLSTPSAIYQARFMRYLEHRGLKPDNGGKIWCFIGDGESDEPEVLGSISMAARERLDNLIMVVNCNLQRLDGPVRGNGNIIQELERSYRGAGWNVIKVIWGSEWDELFSRDSEGVLQGRMDRAVDGDYQFYTVSDGPTVRQHWTEGDPRLEALMKTLSDEQIRCIRCGGQDRNKIYAAFERAAQTCGRPTVILMKTVKDDGMGAAAEGQNTAHQKKQLSAEERIAIGKRFGIPLSDEAMAEGCFYTPPADSDEAEYLPELAKARDALAIPRQKADPAMF